MNTNGNRVSKMPKDITKTQDDDGHWYWIPNEILDNFQLDLQKISGKDYMDCPDSFDDFSEKYEIFRTLGDPNNMPKIFLSSTSNLCWG